MKKVIAGLMAATLGLGFAATALAQTAPAAAPIVKIWNAPAHKTLAQAVIDEVWAKHKDEMAGITFHAKPAGMDKYAMIAGTWPDRVGKASAEDDIMSAEEGFIILDPRYRKNDPEPKYLVIIPLRDQASTNIGAIVFGFKNAANSGKSGPDYTAVATFLRDEMQKKIPSAAALYQPAR